MLMMDTAKSVDRTFDLLPDMAAQLLVQQNISNYANLQYFVMFWLHPHKVKCITPAGTPLCSSFTMQSIPYVPHT